MFGLTLRISTPAVVAAIVLAVALVPPLYVLSIVPAIDFVDYKTHEAIYAPVFWANNQSTVFHEWLVSYANWYRRLTGPPPEQK